MISSWRLIKSPPSDAYTNMALDEAIFQSVSRGLSPSTLRFYSWSPPAVSVGYFQDSLSEVDLDACRSLGIDIVRRLTGGRAVLHDKELTYSVICRDDAACFPDSILETYKIISSCLVDGFNNLGLRAALTPPVRKGRSIGPSACFTSPSHYEITVDGKKLVGSAQRRGEGAFIQHGSILMEFDRKLLGTVLPGTGELNGVASIRDYLNVNSEELVSALIKGFENSIGISFNECEPTCEEGVESQRLRLERYSMWNWNFKRQKP